MLDKILEIIRNILIETGFFGGGILMSIAVFIFAIALIYVLLLCIWVLPFFLIVRFVFHVDTKFFTWLKIYTIGYFGMFAISFIFNSFYMVVFFLIMYLIVCGIASHFKKKN